MGVSGNYRKTFADANMAMVNGIPMDSDYPHFWFDVVRVDARAVTVRNRAEEMTFPIEKGKHGREYFRFSQSSSFEKLFKRPPQEFTASPFQGKRF